MNVKNIPKNTVTFCTKRIKSFIKLFYNFFKNSFINYILLDHFLFNMHKFIINSYGNL